MADLPPGRDLINEVGYTTALVGKWHLGHTQRDYLPTNRGFDFQYGHYNGASLEQEKPIDGKDLWPMLAEGAQAPLVSVTIPANMRMAFVILWYSENREPGSRWRANVFSNNPKNRCLKKSWQKKLICLCLDGRLNCPHCDITSQPKTPTHKMNYKIFILLVVLSPTLLFAASGETVKAKPSDTPAINLYVDVSLGLISEDEAKEKTEKLKADFMATLKSETDFLTGDLYGVRQVSGKQFAALVGRTDETTSFSATAIIGKTKDHAYLEVRIFLKSNQSYVAIVCAPLDDVPVETRKKL